MTDLFLSPHNDDEVIWGTFSLLRHRPHVIVVLRSFVQEARGYGITWRQREAETDAAMALLDVTWEQWAYDDRDPDWDGVESQLRLVRDAREVGRVFAPQPEPEGHPHHNEVGWLAERVFGERIVTHYMTYTTNGKSVGVPVPFHPTWVERKHQAMACYTSQSEHPSTQAHFMRDMTEYRA